MCLIKIREALVNCTAWWQAYQECAQRIKLRTDGKGNCQAQHEEMIMCQDHHVAHHIFDHIKTHNSWT